MLYPLRFRPIYKERIWGGSGLRDELGRELPSAKIGESWEISCREDSISQVAAGPLQGKSLAELSSVYGAELLGKTIVQGNRFPLLLKILDAREILSVQVHPDDDYARVHEGSVGKTEVWYILKAQPGAKIIYGIRPEITQKDFMNALKQGQLAACLNEVAVRPGEIYPIPAGLVHALGKGIMVVELQQNSDLTYRLYDWQRVDGQGQARPLHVEKALQVMEFGRRLPPPLYTEKAGSDFGLENEHFTLYYQRVAGERIMTQSPATFGVLTVVAGSGEIRHQGTVYALQYGDSLLLPAGLGRYSLCGNLQLLLGYPRKPLNIPEKQVVASH